MADMTDDWMNPKPYTPYTSTAPSPNDPIEYRIERQRRVPTFGSPVFEWDYWSAYDTAKERDAALKRIRLEHPRWVLRARDRNPCMEYIQRKVML